jgi:ketosteroid isomerase-like protein
VTASPNLDLVRWIFAAWEQGDFSSSEWAHPDIEFVITGGIEPGSWKGLASAARLRKALSPWEKARVSADDYREIDRERVVVLARMTGRGKTSELDLSQIRAEAAMLFHVRGGQVTKPVYYWDRDHALADLGLIS